MRIYAVPMRTRCPPLIECRCGADVIELRGWFHDRGRTKAHCACGRFLGWVPRPEYRLEAGRAREVRRAA